MTAASNNRYAYAELAYTLKVVGALAGWRMNFMNFIKYGDEFHALGQLQIPYRVSLLF
jgi:hypothetical protein